MTELFIISVYFFGVAMGIFTERKIIQTLADRRKSKAQAEEPKRVNTLRGHNDKH